ncbi:uncharacterized protein LOC101237747 isoform X1 [Hydra vulgaris]|uniref:uncharacterized protein LOC101237747 isoform X1 n=1 Tax=Hydra vulgaris TaxID=6087 RepID=UPI0002B4D05A|nr:uncharacterized protein LOC101237747 [Hydra vulgaris]
MDGYDADFVYEIPSDMECGICLFVVREPVQIMACGHRFCSHCFEKLKTSPAERLRCPKDNGNINLDMVFYDKAAQRAVSNLAVKCSKMHDGCSWQGSLHELEKHVNDCYFHNKTNSVYQEHIKNQLRVLEETIKKKDQEFFDLKNQNSNLEQEFIKHKKEITNLTNNINARLNEIIATNKDLTMCVQQFEKLKIVENIVGNSYDKNTLPGSSLPSPCQKISTIPSDKRITTPIVKLSTAPSPKSFTTISNSTAPFIKPLTASCSSTKPSFPPKPLSVKQLSTPSNATSAAVQLLTTQSNSATQSVQLLTASSVKPLVTTSASTTPCLANTLPSSNNSIPQVVQYPAVSWNHFDEPDWGGELEDWEFDYFEESHNYDYGNMDYDNMDEDEFGYYGDY